MTTSLFTPAATDPTARSTERTYPLKISHLTKRYGHATVVDDLSFMVTPGRVTGFLGPNGSGKSTTMKVLLGLASATGGHATIGGHQYRDLPDPTRTVGAVIESDAFHPGRSGRNHLRVLADTADLPIERVDEMLELVDLTAAADRHAGAYSLGMRQRLGLAAALLGDPRVLILDEPGNGLDPQGIQTLRKLLRGRAASGDTIFVSSHLLAEVEQLADDVVIINHGRLITHGSLEELQDRASLVKTPSPEELKVVLEHAGATVATGDPSALVVRGLALDEIGEHACRAGIALHQLSPHTDSLEARFLKWTDDTAPSDTTNNEVIQL